MVIISMTSNHQIDILYSEQADKCNLVEEGLINRDGRHHLGEVPLINQAGDHHFQEAVRVNHLWDHHQALYLQPLWHNHLQVV